MTIPTPSWEKLDIAKNYETINATAKLFLENFGPAFTNTPKGHIETDIAGAAIISGLMLLRASGTDLTKYQPGDGLIIDLRAEQDLVFRFMLGAANSMGLDYEEGWQTRIPNEHQARMKPLELERKLEPSLYKACLQTSIGKDYYPYVAALTAMKLVAAGSEMKILDLNVGKGIAMFYVILGTKVVPLPLPTK